MIERSKAFLKHCMCAKDRLTDFQRLLVMGNNPLTREGSSRVEERLYLGSILFTTTSGNQEKSPLMAFKGDT